MNERKPIGNTVKFNAVLRNRSEIDDSISLAKSLCLPLHPDHPKNWDSLAAFLVILRHFEKSKDSEILDAGGENYSVILKQLQKVGYTNLTCINLIYEFPVYRDGIRFQYGDLVHTDFPGEHFDAITCLSVVEHGIEINGYFKEMSRLLKPGGILFTSFDYWHSNIDTKGQHAYGVPIKIFQESDVLEMIDVAAKYDLELLGKVELQCDEKVVSWKPYDLEYTFLYLTLKKECC